MIDYTKRFDRALRTSAWAHEQAGQHRKGTDVPYIVHPFAVMMTASQATKNEDVLIACLLHDVLEDVPSEIYDEARMMEEFGERVVAIVRDVTKDDDEPDWHRRSQKYLDHLREQASDEAIIVSLSDKTHNLQSILFDYETVGDELWQRFSTKNKADQIWWYGSILEVVTERQAPQVLVSQFEDLMVKLHDLS